MGKVHYDDDDDDAGDDHEDDGDNDEDDGDGDDHDDGDVALVYQSACYTSRLQQ